MNTFNEPPTAKLVMTIEGGGSGFTAFPLISLINVTAFLIIKIPHKLKYGHKVFLFKNM